MLGDYLDVLPEDIYVNRPMRYLKMENRALLYSVGRSQTDHGGWGYPTVERRDPLVTEVSDDLVFLVGDNPGGNNISAYWMLRNKQREVIELTLVDSKTTRVQDEDLCSLTNLDHLQTLTLRGGSFTDAGLVHLKGLISLKELILSSDNITDAGLVNLKGMTSLHTLRISGAHVTDAGLAELQKALPHCEISH